MPEIEIAQLFGGVESAVAGIKERHPDIARYDEPWWGDKETENMKNRGYVIGFRNDAKAARWRLDYDPVKKLHINWSQDNMGGEASKECYRIQSIRPESTQFDYYVGWTRPRVETVPGDIAGRLGAKKWNGQAWV